MVLQENSELALTEVTLSLAIPVPALRVTGLSEEGRAPTSQYRNSGQELPAEGCLSWQQERERR